MKKKLLRVFISHSSSDKSFAELVASALRGGLSSPWIDKEQVLVGDDVLEKLGEGLRAMDFLVFIVSKNALKSPWVDRELKFAARQEIEQKQILILPFIIDSTLSSELPWYLHHLRADRVSCDERGVGAILDSLKARIARRVAGGRGASRRRAGVKKNPVLDGMIGHIRIGQWKAATAAALEILKETDAAGRNESFEALLGYRNLPDEDGMFWSAMHTVEMCADLAPELMSRSMLLQLALHPNFSVRSSAASICMNWAQFAPDRVPVDILLKLSAHDEDWYVQAPANAALKSMAHAIPGVLQIFYLRLRSADAEEREHAGGCIFDIAQREPQLLDREDLAEAARELREAGDRHALDYIRQSLAKVKSRKRTGRFKYGL